MRIIYIFFAVILAIPTLGQDAFKFSPVNSISVEQAGNSMDLAWAGGLNSAQYGTIDLDGDGLLDLTVFDKTSGKLNTFINNGSEYIYEPQYEYLFPANLNSWILLVDFDCDGRKDIFSNTTFGMRVYRNTMDQQLSFELQEDPLMTESGGIMVNLQVGSSDIPGISDVDGDGDLDILVFRFATGNSIEYHQNQSVENTGSCGELQFKLITTEWGGFQECDCGSYAFGEDCGSAGGRTQHSGGKSILAVDFDHDGDQDLIFGDEFCTNIAYLDNKGDNETALFTDAILDYPNAANPIDFFIFPGLFFEDLNFDGRKDLVASPNVFENFGLGVDFKSSSYLYTNDNVTGGEFFTFQTGNFMQDNMLEFGESAVPTFFDIDGDGDQDMVVGHRGNRESTEFFATFYFYDNIGTSQEPAFSLSSNDYLGFSSEKLNTLKPSFGDIDGDGRSDLLFSAADGSAQTSIYYVLNEASTGFQPATSFPQILSFEIQAGDHPYIADINADGRADLLLGRRTGRLEYWRNNSTGGIIGFELINDAFAGIIDDSFRRELVPMASDLNGDGILELATIDATGVMRIYTNFSESSESSPSQMVFDMLIAPTQAEDAVRSRWGRGASLSSAQLGGQLPHLVVGSRQGGLYLLENFSQPGGGNGGSEFTMELFPNPGKGLVTLRGNQNFTIEVYNTLGQLVMGDLGNPEQSLIRFDSRLLHPGIYLVNGISANGGRHVIKLLVTR